MSKLIKVSGPPFIGGQSLRQVTRRLISRTLWLTIGRRNMVRLGRFLSNESRLDLDNDLQRNGERLVQRVACGVISPGEKVVCIDAGANIGLWSESMLEIGELSVGERVEVHAFEPNKSAFEMLSSRLHGRNNGPRIVLVNKGLSDQSRTDHLYVFQEAGGTNSLHANPLEQGLKREPVTLIKLDDYIRSAQIPRITLLKIDTEGHDLAVIRGARDVLRAGAVDLVQFEYNWRWISARSFLYDAFEFFSLIGYCLGKITPMGIEFYEAWHPELETFKEANYLASRPELVEKFPRIPWWNPT